MSQHELHVNIYDYPEVLVAECIEVPVIVEGKTEEELKTKMGKALDGYFKAFPEKKDSLGKRRTITIPLCN